MTVRELFDFITNPNITSENMEDYLQKLQEAAVARSEQDQNAQNAIDEEVHYLK